MEHRDGGAEGPGGERQGRQRGGYASLLVGIGSWFGFWGCNSVVFQWLLVEAVGATPGQVGTAQMAVNLPALLFLLVGGAVADRVDPTRLSVAVHAASTLVLGLLFLSLYTGSLSYPVLLGYAIGIGLIQAFAFPARDTLLSQVVRGSMSRAVAGATLTQHGTQMLGSLLAGAASVVGAGGVMAFQAALLVGGIPFLARLPRPASGRPRDPLKLRELRAGIAEVASSSILSPVMTLAICTGLLFVGPYLVIIPLMVRDVYAGSAVQLAVLNAMFPLGSVVGGLAIFHRGGIRRCGRALAIGQLTATASIGVLSLGLPFVGSALAVLAWGLSGALFINAGRTLFQSHASEANRARVLSVYTLGVMGTAPLGSLLAGFAVTALGIRATLALDAALAVAVVLSVLASTKLWRLR